MADAKRFQRTKASKDRLWDRLTLTLDDGGAAVVDHAHFLQPGSLVDVGQQGSPAFDLGRAQLGSSGVGLS